ncbi:MAG: PD-(D/E)XK nuclease family protein [Gaiellaceae bacterium]
MPLRLLLGPANAGKVERLLDTYVEELPNDPHLVVPNRGDVEVTEHQLLQRAPCLLGGWVGTFDDLFERIARPKLRARPLSDAQQRLLLRETLQSVALGELELSARFDGLIDSLGGTLAQLEAAMVEPTEIEGPLQAIYAGYRQRIGELGLLDRAHVQRIAVEQLRAQRDAWQGAPIIAYGFEDLTSAQWALLEGLAARTDVSVSLPYEPGRRAFSALSRVANDLGGLARGRVEQMAPDEWGQEPALAYLERRLFEGADQPPPLAGAIDFLEAAGTRASLELVVARLRQLLEQGFSPGRIVVVCPDVERVRRPLEFAFRSGELPFAIEQGERFAATPFGRALLRLLRFEWSEGSRGDLFAFLRSQYSGLARSRVDFVEGRLRGRMVREHSSVEEQATHHLGHSIAPLDTLREAASPVEALRTLSEQMLRASTDIRRASASVSLERDIAAHQALLRTLDQLDQWTTLGGRVEARDVSGALERTRLRGARNDPDRIAVIDPMRARTRRADAVVVLGLEEGSFPRRPADDPLLSETARRALEDAAPRRRLARPEPLAWERYLFYGICTRARQKLVLVREASTDDGRPLEPSPFWAEVVNLFAAEDVEQAVRRRPLSALSWPLERAPTRREQLRSVAAVARDDPTTARAIAASHGWGRQLERALTAFDRSTALRSDTVLERFQEQPTFSVTDLELFGDCSALWFIDRCLSPREIDAQVDPRMRGSIAHQALYRFYAGLPKKLGVDQVPSERLEEAVAFLQECVGDALAGQSRVELSEIERLELGATLRRDLEQFVRSDVALGLPLVPSRFEVAFGSDRAPTELQRGLQLGGFAVSGKIDRIDVDPFSAYGIVQDYKSGRAHSAARIESDGRLQIPLYVMALRDLLGIEPVGGLYRSLSGDREARGLLRAEHKGDLVPGLSQRDYLPQEQFSDVVEAAANRARDAVTRIRAGDVRHDPRDGCPTWCDRWSMCRIARP